MGVFPPFIRPAEHTEFGPVSQTQNVSIYRVKKQLKKPIKTEKISLIEPSVLYIEVPLSQAIGAPTTLPLLLEDTFFDKGE